MPTKRRLRVNKKQETKQKPNTIRLLHPSNTPISLPYESHQVYEVDIHKLYTHDYNTYIETETSIPEYEFQVYLRVAILPILYNQIRDLPNSSIRIPHVYVADENFPKVYTVNNDSQFINAEEQIIKTDHIPVNPVNVTNIKEPHIITKLFPIFKDILQITKLQQVINLTKKIENDLNIQLQFPVIAGVVVVHDRFSDEIHSTLYIALSITRPIKKIKQSSDIKHKDFIQLESASISPQEFAIATLAHLTNKCVTFYNDHILSVQDALDLPSELKLINDKEKIASKKDRKY